MSVIITLLTNNIAMIASDSRMTIEGNSYNERFPKILELDNHTVIFGLGNAGIIAGFFRYCTYNQEKIF